MPHRSVCVVPDVRNRLSFCGIACLCVFPSLILSPSSPPSLYSVEAANRWSSISKRTWCENQLEAWCIDHWLIFPNRPASAILEAKLELVCLHSNELVCSTKLWKSSRWLTGLHSTFWLWRTDDMQIQKKEWQTNKQTRRKKDGRKIRHSKRKKGNRRGEREIARKGG